MITYYNLCFITCINESRVGSTTNNVSVQFHAGLQSTQNNVFWRAITSYSSWACNNRRLDHFAVKAFRSIPG